MTRARSTYATVAGAATSALLIAHHVAGKTVRDALFLSSFPTAALPIVMAAAAVLSLVAALGVSRWMQRRSPAIVMPILCTASAAGLVLEWALGFGLPRATAVLVYLHTTAFGPAMISIFWSLINERFDPHSAKSAIAGIGVGGTVGGVLGALAAWRASSLVELPTLLLYLAALHAACVVGALLIRAPVAVPTDPTPLGPTVRAELRTFQKTPLLRQLGALVALAAVTTALLDYVFVSQAAAAFGTGSPLVSFFALFWLVVSLVSFLVQITLGRVVMKNIGLATSIAVLPAVTIVGGALALALPGLTSTAILRGAEATHHNTLFRSAYEALYTPVAEARKRATKALIDVGLDRFGTVLGSAIAFVVVALAASSSASILLAILVAFALTMLPVAWRVHFAYVGALEQGLREGASGLHKFSSLTAPESKESVAREALIERVEAVSPGGLSKIAGTETPLPGPAIEALRSPEPLLAQARDLLSGGVDSARRVLAAWPGTSRPVPQFAILLLAHEALHRDAAQALRRIAPTVTGELVDALLDPAMDFVVRRRIPRILLAAASQRAADGLLAGIRDERFEVRFECGQALMKLKRKNAEIVVPQEQILAAILVERDKGRLRSDDLTELPTAEPDDDEQEPALVDVLLRDRIDRSLEHVFALLAVHLEPEPLRMAFRALHHEDVRHRGTALEYLHTILPGDIRDAVWPLLGETEPLSEARSAEEILTDLARATSPRA